MSLKVSVIVLSLNGEKVIRACLDSLIQTDYPNMELIVVDNGSSDKTPLIAQEFSQVRLISLPRNRGFAGGNNVGMSNATGDILILLNDDTTVHPDWVKALVTTMESDPHIGIAGCKLLYPDGKTIQHAGGLINEHGLSNHYGKNEIDNGQWDKLMDTAYVTGAAIAIRREVTQILGFLDEGFWPIYFEETDYCFRARKAGYRVVYVPGSVVIHHESQNTGMGSSGFFYKYHKNRMRFMMRNFTFEQLIHAIEPEYRWMKRIPRNNIEFVPLIKAYLFNLIKFPLLLLNRWNISLQDNSRKHEYLKNKGHQ